MSDIRLRALENEEKTLSEKGFLCKNTKGILRLQHSSIKCVPFCADSLNRMPLLAM